MSFIWVGSYVNTSCFVISHYFLLLIPNNIIFILINTLNPNQIRYPPIPTRTLPITTSRLSIHLILPNIKNSTRLTIEINDTTPDYYQHKGQNPFCDLPKTLLSSSGMNDWRDPNENHADTIQALINNMLVPSLFCVCLLADVYVHHLVVAIFIV